MTMINPYTSNLNERLGWEEIWQSNNIPPKYQSQFFGRFERS